MKPLPLRLGPLAADGFEVRQSGVYWLCETGHLCRPNEVVAYCNISIELTSSRRHIPLPFADELELQVAFAPRLAGHLRIANGYSPGGYLNHVGVRNWDRDTVLAYLDPLPGQAESDLPNSGEFRLLMIAGRRRNGLAEVHSGLLPGWHNRKRAWWCDERHTRVPTLLSLGLCDVTGIVLGDTSAFGEIFEAAPAPAQVVLIPDHPNTPSAAVLAEQFTRTPAQLTEIAIDLQRGLVDAGGLPNAADWIFAGALLASLGESPMREEYELLTPSGLRRSGPADLMLLSLNSEGTLLRHKKLGYSLSVSRRHQLMAGPAIRAWLGGSFETVNRSFDDIKRDYLRLFDTVTPVTGGRFAIVNRMSTSAQENISSYMPFDHPMSETLVNIASKELNLMLHDLAAERDIAIIDVDALAAELGAAEHLPDGIHQSGAMQAELRAEVLHVLLRAPQAGALAAVR